MSPEPSARPEPAPRQVGPLPRAFGRYLLFDHIGRGGMADIFLANASTDLGGARRVVIKQILPTLSHDEGFAQLLSAEAKLAAQLNHANVVQVFDLGREGDRLFIAMEYVEGFDLNELLRRLSRAKIPMPAEFALFIVREILRGLDYAHRARDAKGEPLGIVHRDVSPSNVLISFEGEVKLCDFGIARALARSDETRDDEARIRLSRVAGKSAYMAPEHARGGTIDARADVFAAGVLMWELCAGRRLHKGSDEAMLAAAKAGIVPPLPDGGLPRPEDLQRILDRAVAMRPEDRIDSAGDLARAMDDYAAAAKLQTSQLKFGTFLTDHFAEEIVRVRRERERAAGSAHERQSTPEPADGAEVAAAPETPHAPVAEVDAKKGEGDWVANAVTVPPRARAPGDPVLPPRAPSVLHRWWLWAAVLTGAAIAGAVATVLWGG